MCRLQPTHHRFKSKQLLAFLIVYLLLSRHLLEALLDGYRGVNHLILSSVDGGGALNKGRLDAALDLKASLLCYVVQRLLLYALCQ